MQASQRHYLQAMGVQVWQSREVLPGAKPEVLIANVAETAVVEETGDAIAVVKPPAALKTPDTPTVAASDGVSATTQKQHNSAVEQFDAQENLVAEPVTNPEFRLASIIYSGVCMVVTEVPVQSAAPISAGQLHFLEELLLAINVRANDEPLVTFFNWPMLRSAGFDQSAEAAREASQAFLRGQKSRHTIDFVLLMGDVPGQYLLSEHADLAEKTGRLFLSDAPSCLLSYALQPLFAEPKLKAQVWRDLQPLIVWQQQ